MNKSVFQCSFGDGYAGSARMALYGCTQLAKRGFDVTLLASNDSLTAQRGQKEGIKTLTFDTTRPLKEIVASVNAEFEKHKPQFFISYHSLDRKVGRALRSRHGKTFLNIADRQNVSKSVPIIGSLLYNVYFDYLIACSDGVARSLSRSGILKRKIHTIHNAIDIPENLASRDGKPTRRRLNIDSNIVLGLSAWFHKERKGFDILFEALSELDNLFVLLLIGIPAPDQPRVVAYASEFGVRAERIIMPGFVDDVWEYYKAMDFFLLPSRSEGFSLALLEAAAAGIPIVASNIPGTNEFIRHRQNGLLFDVTQPSQLADGVRLLANDATLAQSCADVAMKDVLENFTLERYGEKLENFLERISSP
jgi:glycosyltransferase involved in cell wall biosynthesis